MGDDHVHRVPKYTGNRNSAISVEKFLDGTHRTYFGPGQTRSACDPAVNYLPPSEWCKKNSILAPPQVAWLNMWMPNYWYCEPEIDGANFGIVNGDDGYGGYYLWPDGRRPDRQIASGGPRIVPQRCVFPLVAERRRILAAFEEAKEIIEEARPGKTFVTINDWNSLLAVGSTPVGLQEGLVLGPIPDGNRNRIGAALGRGFFGTNFFGIWAGIPMCNSRFPSGVATEESETRGLPFETPGAGQPCFPRLLYSKDTGDPPIYHEAPVMVRHPSASTPGTFFNGGTEVKRAKWIQDNPSAVLTWPDIVNSISGIMEIKDRFIDYKNTFFVPNADEITWPKVRIIGGIMNSDVLLGVPGRVSAEDTDVLFTGFMGEGYVGHCDYISDSPFVGSEVNNFDVFMLWKTLLKGYAVPLCEALSQHQPAVDAGFSFGGHTSSLGSGQAVADKIAEHFGFEL